MSEGASPPLEGSDYESGQLDPVMNQILRVLIANHEPPLTGLIHEVLERQFAKRREVRTTICRTVEETRDLAAWQDLDLFVLVVNNVILEADDPPDSRRRIGAVVDLIGPLKHRHGRPVAAISGFQERGFLHRLEAAGASGDL
jgi:hypothetical protein